MARLAIYLPRGYSMRNDSGQPMTVYSEAWGCFWTVRPGGYLSDNNWVYSTPYASY